MRPAQQQQQQQCQHSTFGVAIAHGIDYLVSKQRIHFYAMRVRNIWFHIHVFIFTAYALHALQGLAMANWSMQPLSHFHHDQLLMKLKLIKTSWSNRRLMVFFFRFLIYDAIEGAPASTNIIIVCAPRNAPEISISHAVQTLNVETIGVVLRMIFFMRPRSPRSLQLQQQTMVCAKDYI